MSTHEESDSYQSEDKPVCVTVVELSVHLFGQLLFVHELLKDPCSSYRVNLNRRGKGEKDRYEASAPTAATHRLFMYI